MEPQSDMNSIQEYLNKMYFLEQYAENVGDYSAKYNSSGTYSYSPENLTGKPVNYPSYGDFTDSFMLRCYGNWWRESESAQKHYMPQDDDSIGSEEFIILKYETPVIPSSIIIYETYNPGAVVRIYARITGGDWRLLYESEPEDVELIPVNTARCFKPALKQFLMIVNEIRLEFNVSKLKNQMGLDGVLLAGYKPRSELQHLIVYKGLLNIHKNEESNEKLPEESEKEIALNKIDYFETLPYELLVLIFQYLDLKSLLRCARVSKRWYQATLDPAIYQNVSLKRHWPKVDNKTIRFLQKRCSCLRKLDLSWCGTNFYITEDVFQDFLRKCGQDLTHLSICNCDFARNVTLCEITKQTQLRDLRLRNCFPSPWTFSFLSRLTKLVSLDLYCTQINDEALINVLKANRSLKHLIIDFCENLRDMDNVAANLSNFNRKLVSLSCWKVSSLTARGVNHLSRCPELRELDLGWCLVMEDPENCLERIAEGCPNLRRLIISNWGGVTNNHLLPLIQTCKEMVQLDLLSNRHISDAICDWILSFMPKLRLLEISYCHNITFEHVQNWRRKYPNVTIQYQCIYNED